MPYYEFSCIECDSLIESLEPMNTESILCKTCGKQAVKVISATRGYVNTGTPRFHRNSRDKNTSQ